MITLNDLFDLSQFEHRDVFRGVHFPWEVLPKIEPYIKKIIKPGNNGKIIGQAYIANDVQIGPGTVIEPGATIFGPTIIGKNSLIRAGAYIRGRVIIGDEVIIGNSTELKNAIVLNHATAPHFNYVGDSVLGQHVHLGAGAVLSNVKIPISEIVVQTLERVYPTGLQKFGAMLGDNVEVGSNSVLSPGSIIGKGSFLYPMTMFKGVLGPFSILKTRQTQETVLQRGHGIDLA